MSYFQFLVYKMYSLAQFFSNVFDHKQRQKRRTVQYVCQFLSIGFAHFLFESLVLFNKTEQILFASIFHQIIIYLLSIPVYILAILFYLHDVTMVDSIHDFDLFLDPILMISSGTGDTFHDIVFAIMDILYQINSDIIFVFLDFPDQFVVIQQHFIIFIDEYL